MGYIQDFLGKSYSHKKLMFGHGLHLCRCVREGDTAVLSLLWDVFNFTLVWTETAERDMYYLNRAVLNYKQVRALFLIQCTPDNGETVKREFRMKGKVPRERISDYS